ncbi:MAG TPA: RNA polymerase sigma-70 factor [Gemmatimonadaceae bacterium]|jgi:RNA polymerase sigma-70 factor (ECF subfamily)|nr:RNA polymerase sigma-70 factor [Gemmatimonadaceae bacterium]
MTSDRIDATLVARIRAGDASAFETIFTAYVETMCEIAVHYVGVREVAQDLVQDVFFHIWQHRADLVIRESLRVYLYAAVRHRALNVLKHQRIEQRAAQIMPEDEAVAGMGTAPPTADRQLLDDERHQLIQAAIDALPPRQRMVFRLRWEQHLSYEEIGAIMGLSKKGVESARARAIDSLQKKLRGVLGG